MPAESPRMFPLVLDVTALPIFLIGAVADRAAALRDYGAANLHVFAADPAPQEFARLRPRLVFIAGLDPQEAARWRTLAHEVGALVHVQDDLALCDFHLPAILRRGRLQVAVSTDGCAPGLARILRDYLSLKVFGPEWRERVEEVAAARAAWKKAGQGAEKLRDAITAFIHDRGWF